MRYKTVENAVFYVSYGASALLGGFLASAGLYRLGIACDLAAIVLALLVCILFPSDSAPLKERPGKGDPDGEGTGEPEPVTPGAILTWLKGDGIVLALVSMSLTLAFSFVAIEDFYALLLDESGLGAQWSGAAIAVELVLSAAAGLAVPRVLERVRQRRLLVFSKLSQFLLTLAFLLPVVPTPLRPVLYVAGSAISSMGAPLTYSLFHQRVPAGFRGTLISVQSQAVAIGAIAGYGASALVVDALGLNVTLLALFSVTLVAQLAALGYVCRHAPEDQLP